MTTRFDSDPTLLPPTVSKLPPEEIAGWHRTERWTLNRIAKAFGLWLTNVDDPEEPLDDNDPRRETLCCLDDLVDRVTDLQRALAIECGDASAAPEGYTGGDHLWRRPDTNGTDAHVKSLNVFRRGWWGWIRYTADGEFRCSSGTHPGYPTAYAAMEALDAAIEANP